MKVKPLHDKVLIKRLESETKTKSGLYIPDNAKEKPAEGKVIAIGTDEKLVVKEGQTVLFGKYSGNEIKIDGEDFIIMEEKEILAIVEKK